MDKKIKQLTLLFPHGATIKQCEEISRRSQGVVMAVISEGGFSVTSHYGLNAENITFADDSMSYIYGYDKSEGIQNENK